MKFKQSVCLKRSRRLCIKSIIILILYAAGIEVCGSDIPQNRYIVEAGISARLLKNNYTGTARFYTYGLHGTFPVQTDRISVRFGVEYGHLQQKSLVPKTDILLTEIALSRTFSVYGDFLTIHPFLFLQNCALHLNPTGDVKDAVIIYSWENEFGTGIGCDIAANYKLFTFSIPVSASLLFSDKSASVFSAGITAGITLQRRSKGRP